MLFVVLAAAAACRSMAMRPRLFQQAEAHTSSRWNDTGIDVIVNDTVLLFEANLDWMVSSGFGSRMLLMAVLHEAFASQKQGRVMAMTQSSVKTWNDFELRPPVTVAPAESFVSMFDKRPPEGPDAWLVHWAFHPSQRALAYQGLAGCLEGYDAFVWQTFEQAMASFEKPFDDDDYIGMHIRHGDKAMESPIYDLSTFMSRVQTVPEWQDKRNFFVATDDASVLRQADSFHPPEGEYEWRWNDFQREDGGESHDKGHRSSADAIQAVLGDTMSLALAPVLIGNFNSNFDRLAWLLNYLRRTPEQRQERWCWDVFTELPCHDRHAFVVDYVREAMREVPGRHVVYKPSRIEDVQECELPAATVGEANSESHSTA